MLDITLRLYQHCATRPQYETWRTLAPPVPLTTIEATEARLGFSLPAVLRDIYMHIGNELIGPHGYSFLGVSGKRSTANPTIDEQYHLFRNLKLQDSPWQWPDKVVPFFHWGCDIYSCVDCQHPATPVLLFDINLCEPGQPLTHAFRSHVPSLELWIVKWLDGDDLWEDILTLYGSVH